MIKNKRAYIYAEAMCSGDYSKTKIIKELQKKYKAPKYVIKQCEDFLRIADGKDKKYFVDEKKLDKIERLLKAMNMPTGVKTGKTLYDSTCDYQWLLYTSIFCVVEKKNPNVRKYWTIILELARKNYKTFSCGTIFLLLLLLEPSFSKLYSVAPTGDLSREVKTAIENIVQASPMIYYKNGIGYADDARGENKNFKILNTGIRCLLTKNVYKPLNYTNSKFDGKEPKAFLADEVGALPIPYPVEAMQTGQKLLKNKLGCIVSTKYPRIDNPFEDYVLMGKNVLDKKLEDEHLFSLLYEPDNIKDWQQDDSVLMQSNPAIIENKDVWESTLQDRATAIAIESKRENFVTKTCNIIYSGVGTETYIPVDEVIACETEKIDWSGVEVNIGVDLSQSGDNTAVAMVGLDDEDILAEVMIFVPEGRLDEKIASEKLDYRKYIASGECIACGDNVIDYSFIENYVFKLPEKTGCIISSIGYDPWNCRSSAKKWEEKFNVTEITQHSKTLHAPTKLLKEYVSKGAIRIKKNRLLEINFDNCRLNYDTNMNMYVNKKKSTGKVDGVIALINALCLLQDKIIDGENWGAMY